MWFVFTLEPFLNLTMTACGLREDSPLTPNNVLTSVILIPVSVLILQAITIVFMISFIMTIIDEPVDAAQK